MFRQIGPAEIIVIAVVIVIFFGAAKLPELARSIGASAKEFKKGIEDGSSDDDPESESEAVAPDAATPESSDSDA